LIGIEINNVHYYRMPKTGKNKIMRRKKKGKTMSKRKSQQKAKKNKEDSE
jgi:hypothetical protein